MPKCIAVVNGGSSSVKFAFFDAGQDLRPLIHGQVEQIGISPRMHVADSTGNDLLDQEWPAEGFGHADAIKAILEVARHLLPSSTVAGVGHRVVHGGTEHVAPVLVDETIVAGLAKLTPLAPLHQPHNLAPMQVIAQAAPHIPQVACFDTAFHQSQPRIAQIYALPRALTESGIRRYGFHGLSYEYISGRLAEVAPELADKRVIVAHLGNGASLCAMHHGRSVAATMGFTAVDGLMMGTRCGSIDPGVLLYLIDDRGMDARQIERLIYKESGLLGVSGISSDMRTLRGANEPAAAEAVALFVYRIIREIGSLSAALGGLDGLVFTGGIGQHDAMTRREVVDGCGWLGARLDEQANTVGEGQISAASSAMPIWVIPTDEERVIARHTAKLLQS